MFEKTIQHPDYRDAVADAMGFDYFDEARGFALPEVMDGVKQKLADDLGMPVQFFRQNAIRGYVSGIFALGDVALESTQVLSHIWGSADGSGKPYDSTKQHIGVGVTDGKFTLSDSGVLAYNPAPLDPNPDNVSCQHSFKIPPFTMPALERAQALKLRKQNIAAILKQQGFMK